MVIIHTLKPIEFITRTDLPLDKWFVFAWKLDFALDFIHNTIQNGVYFVGRN